MCWTLKDYMMNPMGLYEEWSCEELSLLQAWLGKEDCLSELHVYLQAIIYIKRRI